MAINLNNIKRRNGKDIWPNNNMKILANIHRNQAKRFLLLLSCFHIDFTQ